MPQPSSKIITTVLRALIVFLLLCLISGCTRSKDTNDRESLFVANRGSNSVTVIDATEFKQLATVPVGIQPVQVVANTVRNEVYAVNEQSSSISVIAVDTNQVSATISVPARPVFLSVSTDGTRGYIAHAGSSSLTVLDLTQHHVLASVPLGTNATSTAIAVDGHTIIVPLNAARINNSEPVSSVAIVDTVKLQVRARILLPGCVSPGETVILPDSTKAFIACGGTNLVAAVQLKTTNGKSDRDALLCLMTVGHSPTALALKPDGGELFAIDRDSDAFSEINTSTNEVGGTYSIGNHPAGGVMAADNATLYVGNSGSNNVAIYDITVNRLLASVPVGEGPEALALNSNQNFLFVANQRSGDITIIRTGTRSLFTFIHAGKEPVSLAVKSWTTR